MTPHIDELDRLIDALNAGDASLESATTDPEMAGLLDAVIRVRQLRHADLPDENWAGQAVSYLARELRSQTPTIPAHMIVEPTGIRRTERQPTGQSHSLCRETRRLTLVAVTSRARWPRWRQPFWRWCW